MYTQEQLHVLDVRPGITSLASIRYRNENEILAAAENPDQTYIEHVMPDKLAIDLEYVTQASLWTDVKLIFGTFKAIISN
jgi:lipopolysaccharide/colanic/teichoic acid biosynthesis glycosyltransferase